MEAPDELSLGSKDRMNIVKGKRTKRVRPQSPIPFSVAAMNSSTTGEGDREDCFIGNGDDNINTNNNNMMIVIKDDEQNNTNNNNNNSPTTSSAGQQGSTDHEEEDMANCLILLAQGKSRESPKAVEEDGGISYNKYSSKKFMETSGGGGGIGGYGRTGYYVYECKTCNRTFPSFQALGGHRASHKKPKAMAASMAIGQERKQHQQTTLLLADDEDFHFKNSKHSFLQLNTRGNNLYGNNNNKSKVHECSICGAEFTSGQALGGHMRRHRAPVGTNTTLSLTPMALEPPEEEQPRKRKNVLPLDLDLNLPAPEDDQRESKFAFAPKQQQQHQQHQQQHQQQQQQQQTSLVFSTPSLVDCHY